MFSGLHLLRQGWSAEMREYITQCKTQKGAVIACDGYSKGTPLSLTGENSLVSCTPAYLAFSGESERDVDCCTVSLSDMRSSRFFCWALWDWQFGVTLSQGSFPPLVINDVGYSCCLADAVFVLLVEKW